MTLPAESRVRAAVSLILWTLSGAVVMALFVTIAGDDLPSRIVGGAWAASLMAGIVLNVRSANGRRFRETWGRWLIVVGLEAVILFSAYGMASLKVNRSAATSTVAQLAAVKAGADWRATDASLTEARTLKATLTTRLATTPADYTTAAGKLAAMIADQDVVIAKLGAHLVALETVTGTADTAGLFDVFGHENAPVTQTVVLMLLALLTELTAISLAGKAREEDAVAPPVAVPARAVAPVAHAVAAVVAPTDRAPVAEDYDPDEPKLTASDYLDALEKLKAAGQAYGGREIRIYLKTSYRQVKAIAGRALLDGLIYSPGPGKPFEPVPRSDMDRAQSGRVSGAA